MNNITPTQQRLSSKQNFPLRLFAAAFVISLISAIFGGWQSWQMHKLFDEISMKHVDLAKDIGRIMLLDDVLTMSARMVAASGDFSYEKRYDEFDPQLTSLINDVKADLAQSEIEPFAIETGEANFALVKIERRAFALAHQGKRQEATLLLTSAEYMRLKEVYADGMEKTAKAVDALIAEETRHLHSRFLWLALENVAGVFVLLAVWFFADRSARRWAVERGEAVDALRQSHDELEDRVKQRTADLLGANEKLQHEIAGHKLAAAAMHKANIELSLFRTLLDNSSDIILVVDPITLRYIDVNEKACQDLGYSREKLLSMSVYDTDPSVNPDTRKLIDAQLRKSGTAKFDGIQRRKDGSTFPVEISSKLVNLDKSYVLNIVRDITERKLAEKLLLESEEKFKAIFDNATDGILLADVEEKKLLLGNNLMCRMLGYAPDEIGNLRVMDIHPANELPYVMSEFEKVTRGNKSMAENIPVKRKDGSIFYAEITSAHLNLSGKNYQAGFFRDITERKQAEEEIRKQQELTTQIIETIPMRIFWKDHGLRYLGCNTLFARDAGLLRPDELIDKTDFEMAWKDQAELYRADDQRVMDSNTPKLSYDEPQTTPDGGQIWLRTSKVPLRNKVNETIGVLGIYEDITTYKQVESRLLESEERFRKAFQNSAIGMALVGLDGHWLKVSNSLCQILGYSEKELLDRTFQDITHPDDLQSDLDFIAQLLAGKINHYQMEKRYFHKDGHVVWIHLSVSLIRDAQDSPIHFISQIEDITQFKQAQDALRVSRENLHRLLNSIAEGAYGVDTNGDCTFVNRAFLQMLGYQNEDEVLGKHIHELIQHSHADGSPYPANEFKAYRAFRINQSSHVSDEVFWRKDGVAVPVEYWSHPIESDGVTLGAIVTFVDITVRKQEEAKLAEQLEELRRWHDVTSGREGRILELKHEVNEILDQVGQPPRYPSAESQDQTKE